VPSLTGTLVNDIMYFRDRAGIFLTIDI
jgi:hypothetical protein